MRARCDRTPGILAPGQEFQLKAHRLLDANPFPPVGWFRWKTRPAPPGAGKRDLRMQSLAGRYLRVCNWKYPNRVDD